MCYSRELLTPFNPNSLQRTATQRSGRPAARWGHGGLHTPCNGVSPPSLYMLGAARCSPRSCWWTAPFHLAFLQEGHWLSWMVVKPCVARWGCGLDPPRRLSRATSARSSSHVTDGKVPKDCLIPPLMHGLGKIHWAGG